MKQNAFADLEDELNKEDGFYAMAIVANILAFFGLLVFSGSFWFAAIATLFFCGVIGGGAVLVVAVVSMIFARREEDGWKP
ncbi:MAG: hypothetical protein LBU46_04840 [Candidatus Accumulibacter sp.]|jgi:hypothetical protein|nr:hypothetical protein [Accumulibacter sp.]